MKLYFLHIRHFFWFLWFVVPGLAFVGWFHAGITTQKPKYFVFSAIYGFLIFLACINSNLAFLALLVWVVGIAHAVKSYSDVFREVLECREKNRYLPNNQEDYDVPPAQVHATPNVQVPSRVPVPLPPRASKVPVPPQPVPSSSSATAAPIELNTADFHLMMQNRGLHPYAAQILANRHQYGPFASIEDFYARLRVKPEYRLFFASILFVDPRKISLYKPQKESFFSRLVSTTILTVSLVVLFGVIAGALLVLMEINPDLKQYVYFNVFGQHAPIRVSGSGSGTTRDEALYRAKIDALRNAFGETMTHAETGQEFLKSISDENADTSMLTIQSREEYARFVTGHVREYRIVGEYELDGLIKVTIFAHVKIGEVSTEMERMRKTRTRNETDDTSSEETTLEYDRNFN